MPTGSETITAELKALARQSVQQTYNDLTTGATRRLADAWDTRKLSLPEESDRLALLHEIDRLTADPTLGFSSKNGQHITWRTDYKHGKVIVITIIEPVKRR